MISLDRSPSNILTPSFGQAAPAVARRMGVNAMRQSGTAGRVVSPAIQRPGMQAVRTQPAAQKARNNNVLMLAGLLGVASIGLLALRNTHQMIPMVKTALEEQNKAVVNATKTSPWGLAKDLGFGGGILTALGFGAHGAFFRKIEDTEARRLAGDANSKIGKAEKAATEAATSAQNAATSAQNANNTASRYTSLQQYIDDEVEGVQVAVGNLGHRFARHLEKDHGVSQGDGVKQFGDILRACIGVFNDQSKP